MSPALFLDRDDTLIRDVPYLHQPDLIVPLPGAAQALALAREAGYLLFLFTNQSGINRGYFNLQSAIRCCRETAKRLGLQPGPSGFCEICIAPELPEEKPVYRKPSPRFILEAIQRYHIQVENSWMIGDRDSDLACGRAAGLRVAQIQPPTRPSSNQNSGFPSLLDFVLQEIASPGLGSKD
ncbi:MAG: D-glycero-alpha-D-manno-heptose-1,7-bisphosphate 7-phosphatase [Puniceicoccaceae bacterium]